MGETETILMLGSAPDVERCREWPRTGIDRIVALNNAWQVRTDWDDLVHPKDFPEERKPDTLAPEQRVHSYEAYVPAVNAFGGFVFCGGTMAFTAAYWVLHTYRPGLIAILGCDMMYGTSGRTHFYGRGSADPLRSDVTLQSLEAKSVRLGLLAAWQGCAVVNLSNLSATRLAHPRVDAAVLARWNFGKTERFLHPLVSPGVKAAVNKVLEQEAALSYRVPSGEYWKESERFDPMLLRRIDTMWLDLVNLAEAAA
jgi:hypothetical protein